MRNNIIYVIGDGDNIRSAIERKIFRENFKSSLLLSEGINNVMSVLKEKVVSINGATLVLCGGDDICFFLDASELKLEIIEEFMRLFYAKTGESISFGVGKTIDLAYVNLRKAKAFGGGRVVSDI